MRERRRQFGLPLPIADKVLPFRPCVVPDTAYEHSPLPGDDTLTATDPLQLRVAMAEEQVAASFAALQDAELRGASRQALDRLEEAYRTEVATYEADVARLAPTL